MDEGEEDKPVYQIPSTAWGTFVGTNNANVNNGNINANVNANVNNLNGNANSGATSGRKIVKAKRTIRPIEPESESDSDYIDSDIDLDDVDIVSDVEPPKPTVVARRKVNNHPASFWQAIGKIFWADRSDQVIDINRTKVQIAGDLQLIRSMYPTFANTLKGKLLASADFNDNNTLDANGLDQLVSHIIARGVDMYNAIMDDPTICLYLLAGEYQDFTAALR